VAALSITHRFPVDEMPAAYDVFSDPQHTGALKVALTRS
jgi:alcohol dehydrogenase